MNIDTNFWFSAEPAQNMIPLFKYSEEWTWIYDLGEFVNTKGSKFAHF